ncbi:MAG: ABC transporter substrate-binding protein [bacterium]
MHRLPAAALGVVACAAATLALAGPAPVGAVAPRADDGLVIGTALPDTGELSDYGRGTQAGVLLAVQDINAAGGVAGSKVTLVPGNSGGTGDKVFARTVGRLVGRGAQAIVGPLSSQLLLDNLSAVKDVAVVSPAASSDRLTGKVFRVVPAESLQGGLLGSLAVEDGVRRLAIVARNSSGGVAREAAKVARAADVSVRIVTYPDRTEKIEKVAGEVASYRPDSVIFAGGNETGALLSALVKKGIPTRLYFTSASGESAGSRDLPSRTLEGAKMVSLDLRVDGYFGEQLKALDPRVKQTEYSPQAYDAAVVIALAAEQAAQSGPVTPETIRANIASVTTGGRACRSVATCLTFITLGEDIAYVGPAGELRLKGNGSPSQARYAISTFGSGNKPGGRPRYVVWPSA